MRISTNTIYQTGISKISSLQSEQARLQQQISSGKRILTPSDDPVAASRALEMSQAQSVNAQYADNRKSAEIKLSGLESSLSSITDLLTATQSTVIGAGNGALSNTERGFIASELSGKLEALIGLANTQDAAGNYIYAGFQSATPAFAATAAGATYNGDTNQQLLQVDGQRQMAVSATGDSVFQAKTPDIFSTFSNLVTLLNTPVTDAATQSALTMGIATAIGSLQSAADNVLTIRASVGSKLNEIDSLNTAGSSRDLQYTQALSDLQDLDYAKALSDMSQRKTILEAAQKSFVATTSLSLFDFIR
jgi:flagellar hook-associated protein 3 FlgL